MPGESVDSSGLSWEAAEKSDGSCTKSGKDGSDESSDEVTPDFPFGRSYGTFSVKMSSDRDQNCKFTKRTESGQKFRNAGEISHKGQIYRLNWCSVPAPWRFDRDAATRKIFGV
jgi:hypothetical protein